MKLILIEEFIEFIDLNNISKIPKFNFRFKITIKKLNLKYFMKFQPKIIYFSIKMPAMAIIFFDRLDRLYVLYYSY